MNTSTPVNPRLRWNSLFVKLSALVLLAAVIVVGITSVLYTRATLSQVEATIARAGAEVNHLMARDLAGAVLSNAPGPVERAFDDLVAQEGSGTEHGLAINGAGLLLAAKGRAPEDEGTLLALAQSALESGAPQGANRGMLIAHPVLNAFTGAPAGAVATSWTSRAALASAMSSQVEILAIVAAVVLAGVGLLVIVLQRGVTRPLVALAGTVDRLAADDLDVSFPTSVRGDELGALGRSLDILRDRLRQGREEARENRFRGEAFASSSAAIMMVDAELRVISLNLAVTDILAHYAEDFRRTVPGFDPTAIIGQSMDYFHPGAMRGRVSKILSDPEAFPYKTEMSVGAARFCLTINRVEDQTGALEGFVVEWEDVTKDFIQTAVLTTIETNQAQAEFDCNGKVLHVNALFARAMGAEPQALVGQDNEAIFAFDETLARDKGKVFERLHAGSAVYGSFQIKRLDGTRGVIDGSFTPVLDTAGKLLRIILIGSDVTEANRALEQAEAVRTAMLDTQARVVEALRNGLEWLAEGDLTNRIVEPMPEDYDQLRTDFNRAADRLQEAIRKVIENANMIQGEAAEISSAADDLSTRTERQAATLEETATALDQLTASVKSAAEGAAHANGLVENARENAQASGEVVRQAVDAMGAIETSSQQISKITGVIDDIAFQTNLLALNAGVEAARAGEAGRGFAVVASEVRALAQRSSDAAREINALIAASGSEVKRGVDLVGQAGEALKGIVESVTEISRNVSEIAVSSREQSVGLGEINAAVNQLDQVTQQNAAMFEQTTAASHALNREAEALTGSMGRFRIAEGPPRVSNVIDAPFISTRPRDQTPAPESAKAAVAVKAQPEPITPMAPLDDHDGWDEF